MRKALCLLCISSLYIVISGCATDTEPGPPPEVISVSVAGTWELTSIGKLGIPSNAGIAVAFSKEMNAESVIISLDNLPVASTSIDNMTFELFPPGEGEYQLSIFGEDVYSQPLDPPYLPIVFQVVSADEIPPHIVDEECMPENGADWVPASDVSQIIIAFSEPMARLDVISYDPDFLLKEKLSPDRKSLTIDLSPIGGLPSETDIEIKLRGMDMAGNELQPSKYSFTTRPMWSVGTIILELLFDIEAEHQLDLDERQVSNALIQEFGDNGCQLSQRSEVMILREGKEWLIATEGKEAYFAIKAESKVRKDEERIYIYLIAMLL